jgi:hypothetical protein
MRNLIFFLSIILVCTGCLFEGMCGNEISKEVVNPSGLHRLVRFNRDCGATTSGSSQVSILSANRSLPDEAGNIFVADRCSLEMKWVNDHEVLIRYEVPVQVFVKEEMFNGIKIRYDTFYIPPPVFDSTKKFSADVANVKRVEIKHGEWNDPHWQYVNGVSNISITDIDIIDKMMMIMQDSKISRYPGLHKDWLHVGFHYKADYFSAVINRTSDNKVYFEVKGEYFEGEKLIAYLQKHTKP